MTNGTRDGGLSLATVLLVIFVVLKLTGNIAWSWWWVFSPWWISFALVALYFGVVLVIGGVATIIDVICRNRRLNTEYKRTKEDGQ
jgi:membrane protein YdbS with pleckstrin-like domain